MYADPSRHAKKTKMLITIFPAADACQRIQHLERHARSGTTRSWCAAIHTTHRHLATSNTRRHQSLAATT